MAALTIDVTQLRKTYGTRAAVRDLTLQVARGEAFGFLGAERGGQEHFDQDAAGPGKAHGWSRVTPGKAGGHA